MLTDAEFILLLLAGFYLLETIYWVKPGAGVWVSAFGFGHRFKTAFRSALLANPSGGLIFGNFLPLGSSTCCEPWPFCVSARGILAFSPLQLDFEPILHSRRFVPFSEIKTASIDGRKLFLNGQFFLTAASQSLAKRYRQLIESWRSTSAVERAAQIENDLRQSFDVESARTARKRALEIASPLRNLCISAMIFAFGLVPILLYFSTRVDWIRLLILYLGIQILIAYFYMAAHRALLRDHFAERLKNFFAIALSPADAMHACDTLLREAMESWHPLTLAFVLGSEWEAGDLAARYVRDARNPLPNDFRPESAAAMETLTWYIERYTEDLAELGRDGGAVPLRDSTASCVYCPRCLAQAEVEPCECTVCGLLMKPF